MAVFITQLLNQENSQKLIVIVGGGIAGLAAAWELRQQRPHCRITIVEGSSELGGLLKTDSIGGYLVERSADMFTTDPDDALQFVRQLGREQELITTNEVRDRAYIAVDDVGSVKNSADRLLPVPSGFSLMLPMNRQAVLDSELLDEAGKIRFLQEQDIAPRVSDADESLQDFAIRRFGQATFDSLIQPLVSGIYTADPTKLSMQATMSRFLEMEREHGSLLAAAAAKQTPNPTPTRPVIASDQAASGARYDLFRAPREGMGKLIDWIVGGLADVEFRMATEIRSLTRRPEGWRLALAKPPRQTTTANATSPPLDGDDFIDADGLILATSAQTAGRLLEHVDGMGVAAWNGQQVAMQLSAIERASCAVVAIGLDQRQFRKKFAGFGIVVPHVLQNHLVAASFSSNKFVGRAPEGKTLIRCFIGGALNRDLVDLPDEKLLAVALQQLDRWFGIDGTAEIQRVYRWIDAMPQYHLGHLQKIEQIERSLARVPTLALVGNSYNGVGIPVCLKSGREGALRLLKQMKF